MAPTTGPWVTAWLLTLVHASSGRGDALRAPAARPSTGTQLRDDLTGSRREAGSLVLVPRLPLFYASAPPTIQGATAVAGPRGTLTCTLLPLTATRLPAMFSSRSAYSRSAAADREVTSDTRRAGRNDRQSRLRSAA